MKKSSRLFLWHLPLILWVLNFMFSPSVQLFELFGQEVGKPTTTPLQMAVITMLSGQYSFAEALWWANLVFFLSGVAALLLSSSSLQEERNYKF